MFEFCVKYDLFIWSFSDGCFCEAFFLLTQILENDAETTSCDCAKKFFLINAWNFLLYSKRERARLQNSLSWWEIPIYQNNSPFAYKEVSLFNSKVNVSFHDCFFHNYLVSLLEHVDIRSPPNVIIPKPLSKITSNRLLLKIYNIIIYRRKVIWKELWWV